MSQISYFQKYTQKENHITNNTLLMFRHLYRYSHLKFESVLQSITDDTDISVGLCFEQQIRSSNSVPDAVITQSPINIYIEAKTDGKLNIEQIERHINSIHNQNNQKPILIGLSKEYLSDNQKQIMQIACDDKNIRFVHITYTDLLKAIDDVIPDYEDALKEIVTDYEQCLSEAKMLYHPFNMIAVPCGSSWNENIKYSLYYEPTDRPIKILTSPFIGIYTKKHITHFGRIKGTIINQLSNGIATFDNVKKEWGDIDADDIETIKEAIAQIKIKDHDLIKKVHRFYIIEQLYEVNIPTPYIMIRSSRPLNLKKLFPNEKKQDISTDKIAEIILAELKKSPSLDIFE